MIEQVKNASVGIRWVARVAIVGVMPLLAGCEPGRPSPPESKTAPNAGLTELTGGSRPALPEFENLRCFTNDYGWIYAPDEKTACDLHAAEEEAALLFRKHFGSLPEKGVYFTMPGEFKEPAVFIEQVRTMGAHWFLPHIGRELVSGLVDEKELHDLVSNQIREQVGLKLPDWLVSPLMKTMHNSIVQQIEQQLSHNVIAAHELGHAWFIAKYWPDCLLSLDTSEQHYGGPASDWLDEAAAILMEDETLSASRRTYFADAFANTPDLFIPLARLFSMSHPNEHAAEEPAVGIRVVVTVKSPSAAVDAQDKQFNADMFYAEIRVLADFMLERSNNDLLFASIAEAERAGQGMAGWLKAHGPANTLPETVAELEKEFIAWVSARKAE